MSATELAAFEHNPHFEAAVRLRLYDDGGKRVDWDVPSLESYRPLLVALGSQVQRLA
ncbi:hypothetical protein NHF48_001655 [Sphingomonas sp. H160509]|uniref:hypothetical protein n=1 Tax=Sphingomonas sp. H160509 TaxID=2955313 RepID=UPI0020983196|nr:hypothetical protein [Sphingomonas sp. H160509]MDD1449936.1 hypothetical protein [Sphingomonas sp. H160509]